MIISFISETFISKKERLHQGGKSFKTGPFCHSKKIKVVTERTSVVNQWRIEGHQIKYHSLSLSEIRQLKSQLTSR